MAGVLVGNWVFIVDFGAVLKTELLALIFPFFIDCVKYVEQKD